MLVDKNTPRGVFLSHLGLIFSLDVLFEHIFLRNNYIFWQNKAHSGFIFRMMWKEITHLTSKRPFGPFRWQLLDENKAQRALSSFIHNKPKGLIMRNPGNPGFLIYIENNVKYIVFNVISRKNGETIFPYILVVFVRVLHARGIPLACKTRTNTTKMYGKMVSPFFLEITLKTMYFTLFSM